MSEPVETVQRTCRYPGCEREVPAADGLAGRPPEYCDDPGHTRAAAWRARQRLAAQAGGRGSVEEDRPVDAARQRASEIRGQVAGMAEHLTAQFAALAEELRTLADPEAAEAQIESVTSDAAEKVAGAAARATRAEAAERKAQAEREEADAAAAEASELAEQLTAALGEVRGQLGDLEVAQAHTAAELAEQVTAAAAAAESSRVEIADLGRDLQATRGSLAAAEAARDAGLVRAQDAEAGRVAAEEVARGAVARAEGESARAERAETQTAAVREQLELARAAAMVLQEQVGALRGDLATVTAERDAARADVERERTHGDQRVGDLRATHTAQLAELREDLATVRTEAREQRSRADRAETARPAGKKGSSGAGQPQ